MLPGINNFSLEHVCTRLTDDELSGWIAEAKAYAQSIKDPALRAEYLEHMAISVAHKKFVFLMRRATTVSALSDIVYQYADFEVRCYNMVTFISCYAKTKISLRAFERLLRTGNPYAQTELLNPGVMRRVVDAPRAEVEALIRVLKREDVIAPHILELAERHAGGSKRSVASLLIPAAYHKPRAVH
jgi:hypothetical protein